jgi:hypothetical protein
MRVEGEHNRITYVHVLMRQLLFPLASELLLVEYCVLPTTGLEVGLEN